MRFFLYLLTVFLFVFPVANIYGQQVSIPSPVKVALFPLEPLNFEDKEGGAQGIYPDIINKIARIEDWEIEFVKCNWSGCLDKLQKQDINVMTTIAFSEERAKNMDYNRESVIDIWGQVYLQPGNKFNNFLELDGRLVGIMKRDINGYNFIKTAEKFGVRCEIREYSNHDEVFNAVKYGEVDAGVAPQHFGLRHAKKYDLVASAIQFSPFSVYFATKKGQGKHMLDRIDFHLSKWKQDKNSFYYQRLSYWLGGKEFEKEIIPVWLVISVVVISLVTMLLYVLNRTLNFRVKKRTFELEKEISVRKVAEIELQKIQDNLEKLVEDRTLKLQEINQQLQQEKQRAQNYLDLSKVMLLALDVHGNITLLNPKGCEILEVSPQEVLGKNWFDTFLPQENYAEVKEVFKTILTGEMNLLDFHENTVISSSGELRMIEFHNSLLTDNMGEICGILSSGTDITEKKKNEEEKRNMQAFLYQQEKLASVGQLAAGVAHEINNPMGFITSNLNSMEKYVMKINEFMESQEKFMNLVQDDAGKEELQVLRKKMKINFIQEDIIDLLHESLEGADRVTEIVKNLKSFSRLDEEKIKAADVNECLESTIKVIWNELKYKVTLHKDYGEIPLVMCNAQKLNQVFINLLINAAHAIEKEGDVHIRSWYESGKIMVAISDNGKGIDSLHLNKIFEPFFTTKEVGKGTGLGLSISYDIIKEHNGDIVVDSQVGKGTTFTVSLPVK